MRMIYAKSVKIFVKSYQQSGHSVLWMNCV